MDLLGGLCDILGVLLVMYTLFAMIPSSCWSIRWKILAFSEVFGVSIWYEVRRDYFHKHKTEDSSSGDLQLWNASTTVCETLTSSLAIQATWIWLFMASVRSRQAPQQDAFTDHQLYYGQLSLRPAVDIRSSWCYSETAKLARYRSLHST